MADDNNGVKDGGSTDEGSTNPGSNPPAMVGTGPGASMLGVPGIITLATFLVFSTVAVMYVMLVIWPIPTPSRQEPPTTDTRTAIAPASTEAVSKTSAPIPPPSQNNTR